MPAGSLSPPAPRPEVPFVHRPETPITTPADPQPAIQFQPWNDNPDQPTWSPALAELIDWFEEHEGELPLEPFDLALHIRVVDPAKSYAALRQDIDKGPTGSRGRSGALEAQLGRLRGKCRNYINRFRGASHAIRCSRIACSVP